jgi:hypothetical protein
VLGVELVLLSLFGGVLSQLIRDVIFPRGGGRGGRDDFSDRLALRGEVLGVGYKLNLKTNVGSRISHFRCKG